MKYVRALAAMTLFVVLTLGLASPLLTPARVSAVDVVRSCNDPTAPSTDLCQAVAGQKANGSNPVINVIKMAIGIVSYIGGAAAVISLIIFGLRIMLANGDSNTISSSRTGILYAMVGIAVIVFAQIIVVFVLNKVK